MKRTSLLFTLAFASLGAFGQFGEVKPGTITIYEPPGFGALLKPNLTFAKVSAPDILLIGYNNTDATLAHLGVLHSGGNRLTKFYKNGTMGIGYSLLDAFDETALGVRYASSLTNPHMKLINLANTEPARLNFENVAGNYWQLKGFASNTAASAIFNINSSNYGDVLSLTGQGNVGIRTSSPTFPFEVNTVDGSINSTTGAMSVGTVAGRHLVFDSDEINGYNGTSGGTLTLNDDSDGLVLVGGTGAATSNFRVNGFSQLGGISAPNIKMKKLIGNTGATSTTDVAHGLDYNKIISFDVLIEQSSKKYQPNSLFANSAYHYVAAVGTTSVELDNVGSALRSRPYIILITYEE
jgi:hypothetical protein